MNAADDASLLSDEERPVRTVEAMQFIESVPLSAVLDGPIPAASPG